MHLYSLIGVSEWVCVCVCVCGVIHSNQYLHTLKTCTGFRDKNEFKNDIKGGKILRVWGEESLLGLSVYFPFTSD